jgi:hypothetical protein
MAKEIIYRCNLCGDRSAEQSKYVGVRFDTNKIEIAQAIHENNHLCRDCVKNLKAAFGYAER